MSYFKNISSLAVTTLFQFQTPGIGVQNAIKCKDGKIAAWEFWKTDSDGNHLIKIYDATSGTLELIATVYALAGRDLFCGLFTTGAIPSGDIFDAACVYYRVDYI